MKKITFIMSICALSLGLYFTACKKSDTTPSTTTTGGTTGTTAGTTSGTTAGTTSGTTAGTTSGTTAGTTSGTTAGTTAGTTSGTTAGTTSGGTNGYASFDTTYSTSTYQMWVNNAASMSLLNGANCQVWFKAKPTTGGSYTITDFMTALTGGSSATEVGIAYLPGGSAPQYWSTATSGGTVSVTVTGAIVDITVSNVTLCVNTTTTCGVLSAHFNF